MSPRRFRFANLLSFSFGLDHFRIRQASFTNHPSRQVCSRRRSHLVGLKEPLVGFPLAKVALWSHFFRNLTVFTPQARMVLDTTSLRLSADQLVYPVIRSSIFRFGILGRNTRDFVPFLLEAHLRRSWKDCEEERDGKTHAPLDCSGDVSIQSHLAKKLAADVDFLVSSFFLQFRLFLLRHIAWLPLVLNLHLRLSIFKTNRTKGKILWQAALLKGLYLSL